MFDNFDWLDSGLQSLGEGAAAATGGGGDPGIQQAIDLEPSAFANAAQIGAANPATFQDQPPQPTATPQSPQEGPGASQAGVGPGVMGGQGQEAGIAPQAPPPTFKPGSEATRAPGGWWQQFARNAGTQLQKNPWGALGYGLTGAGIIGGAVQAGMQGSPKATPWTMPSYPGPAAGANTPADQTLPPPGPGVSPILKQGMNVRPSTGIR